jgi:glc operon protein GlcG
MHRDRRLQARAGRTRRAETAGRSPSGGRIVASGGCAPIFKSDEMVGAYGISGGTSDQDEIMARYARDKVGWAHTPERDTTPDSLKAHINQLYSQVGLGDRKL